MAFNTMRMIIIRIVKVNIFPRLAASRFMSATYENGRFRPKRRATYSQITVCPAAYQPSASGP